MSMASPSSRNQTSLHSAMATTTKSQRNKDAVSSSEKRSCMCSPTSHPGSFRCAYHKQLAEKKKKKQQQQQQQTTLSSLSSRRLNLLRSAMKNSVVRIGGVEADQIAIRRALNSLVVRPSSQQYLRRREAFQPRPTRLSLMSTL